MPFDVHITALRLRKGRHESIAHICDRDFELNGTRLTEIAGQREIHINAGYMDYYTLAARHELDGVVGEGKLKRWLDGEAADAKLFIINWAEWESGLR